MVGKDADGDISDGCDCKPSGNGCVLCPNWKIIFLMALIIALVWIGATFAFNVYHANLEDPDTADDTPSTEVATDSSNSDTSTDDSTSEPAVPTSTTTCVWYIEDYACPSSSSGEQCIAKGGELRIDPGKVYCDVALWENSTCKQPTQFMLELSDG